MGTRATLCLALLLAGPHAQARLPARPAPARREILIGVEYAAPGLGKTFAALGVPAAKHYPDATPWGAMQPRKDGPIDFGRLDRFVREYQSAGFRELVIVLKAKSPWASRDPARNFAPRPEHAAAFERWVGAVVERYDRDGKDDMPGLKYPVRFYELGSEFSTFEPTPTADYLEALGRAYRAAHSAFDRVVFLHAAFLVTTAFKDRPSPARYAAGFAAVDRRILHKGLADIRKVLDRPRLFDALNFHSLGDPYEIEDTVAWLRWEMKQRGYNKPIVISDTTPTPFIAWGPATRAEGPARVLGVVVPPATERDRPRLARYFTRLVEGDRETQEWNHAFVAGDMIRKVVVAAEQGVGLINTSFTEDLTLFKAKALQAGAGTSAWAGMAEVTIHPLTQQRTVRSLRPGYHALGRLQYHLAGYTGVERVRVADARVRLYKFSKGKQPLWVAWLDPGRLLLPGDPAPEAELALAVGSARLEVEKAIDRAGQVKPDRFTVPARDGVARVPLSIQPVFLRPAR